MEEILSNNWFVTVVGGALASLLAAIVTAYLLNRRPSVLKLYRKALHQICDISDLNITKDEKRVLQKTLNDQTIRRTIKIRTPDPGPEARQLCKTIAYYAPLIASTSSRLADPTFASQVVAQLLYTEFMMENTDEYHHFYLSRQPYFAVPPAPTGLVLTATAQQQIILTWNPVQHPSIRCYHITRSTAVNGPFTKLGSIAVSPGTLLSFTDANGLTDGTKYYYTISAEASALRQGHFSAPAVIDYHPFTAQADQVDPETSSIRAVLSTFFTPQDVWKEIANKSIDREQELEKLLKDFRNAKRRLFLIEGFGGVGKTTLASRFATVVSEQYNVLWIDCRGIPVTAERFLREMGVLASEQYKYPLLSAVVENSRLSQEEKNRELLDFLPITNRSKNDVSVKPIAFFFDDYHLVMDAGLRKLVLQIAESYLDVKVVLVIRYLPSELQDEVDTTNALQLPGLDVDGCRELIGAYASNYPALKAVNNEKLQRIWELTGQGVPAALRILISLTRKLSLDDVLEELPTLTAVTREKWFDKLFHELSPEEQQVATEASIFRRPISRRALVAMSRCTHVRDIIDTLVDRFVLTFDGQRYSMHALWLSYTTQRLSLSEARELHLRAALLYRDLGAKEQHAERIMSHLESCYHFIQAEDMEQAEQEFLLIASTLHLWGFFQEFTDILDKIESYAGKHNKTLNPTLILEKNDVLYKRGFVDDAILTLNELIHTETGEIKIQALSQLAWIKHREGDRREAERLFEQSIQLARQFVLPKLEGEALHGLQSIAYFESDYVKAMEYNQESLKVFEQLQDDPEAQASIALIYLDIGGIYREQGLYSEAMAAYQKDLEILHTLGDPPYHLGWLNYNMGNALFGQKQWYEAQERFEAALHYFEKMQHVGGIAHAKIELGRVGSKINQNHTSVELVEEAITLLRHIKLTAGEASGLRALGEIYLNFGEPDQALPYLQQSLEMDEKILHGVKGIASSLHRISLAYEQKAQKLLSSAQPSEAILCFHEARSMILRAQALFAQMHTIPNFDGILDDVSRIEQECVEYDETK